MQSQEACLPSLVDWMRRKMELLLGRLGVSGIGYMTRRKSHKYGKGKRLYY